MNSKDFQTQSSKLSSLSQDKVERLLDSTVSVMLDRLEDNNSVSIQGFGTFEVRKKEQRLSVNPVTQKRTLVPPKLVLAFRTSNSYKDKIKRPASINEE